MSRFKLTIEYDGTPFVGWQRQPDRMSVQQALEEAIRGFSGEEVTTQAAGRTDSGVHAKGQVAHFDLTRAWDPFRVGEALNYHLKPHPISIIACEAVPESFEARFSAIRRYYEYRILNRRARPGLEVDRVWHVPAELDAGPMHEAAQLMLGQHDFTTFRAAECQANSPVKTLDHLAVIREGEHVLVTAHACSFLHHMVRSLVGSLKMVGEGRWEVGDMKKALDARDRSWCGPLAPSAGLYLTQVDYPETAPESAA